MNHDDIISGISTSVFGSLPESAERCTVGMVNTVYRLSVNGRRCVLRLNSERGSFDNSADILRRAAAAGVPVPSVIAQGEYGGAEYIILSYIKGKDLGIVYHELTDAQKRSIAAETVDIQRKAAGIACDNRPDPWYGMVYELLSCAEERLKASGHFDSRKAAFVRNEAGRLAGYFERLTPVTYLDDISTKNLMIHDGHVSGVVDIDELGFGDPLTVIGLTRTALLNMGLDDDICGYMLDEMNADREQRRAELFYSIMYCADFMGERGQTFDGRTVEVNREVVARLNGIYDTLIDRWNNSWK